MKYKKHFSCDNPSIYCSKLAEPVNVGFEGVFWECDKCGYEMPIEEEEELENLFDEEEIIIIDGGKK